MSSCGPPRLQSGTASDKASAVAYKSEKVKIKLVSCFQSVDCFQTPQLYMRVLPTRSIRFQKYNRSVIATDAQLHLGKATITMITSAFCTARLPRTTVRRSRPSFICSSHQRSSRLTLSSVEAQVASRGYCLQNHCVGPLLNISILRAHDQPQPSYAGAVTGAILPNNRLHIESYKAIPRDADGGLLHLSPGMMLFIAALAFANEKGVTNVYGLAIRDAPQQHRRLVRYLKKFGGVEVQKVTESIRDVPARMFYGGVGTVIRGNVPEMLERGCNMFLRT